MIMLIIQFLVSIVVTMYKGALNFDDCHYGDGVNMTMHSYYFFDS